MRIGQLAQETGVSVRSLRYYEQQGLISPIRQENGYRDYSPLTVHTVEAIKLYLNLGLSTEQIAGFLTCVLRNKEAFCAEIMPVYEKKLAEIEAQIQQLTQIRSNLLDRIAAFQAERAGKPDE
ncbi:DNA-binding transcriptional MerR regulator [Paenibacillus phyllosphaerae]|uniref:DNA-binding transcriptional MerR regulator n=1 Tax=Paenibacillus phyllosphaerae TaxID=274593 RepID=A0A7W5FNI9_9BACL|nr:MerR family transcriptional regulator [Paenibacillus phyllosphaerae]MBB3111192.1 DNA-binding transcriptional MerR regulator [Paenibacillus phyllosphaerae]